MIYFAFASAVFALVALVSDTEERWAPLAFYLAVMCGVVALVILLVEQTVR